MKCHTTIRGWTTGSLKCQTSWLNAVNSFPSIISHNRVKGFHTGGILLCEFDHPSPRSWGSSCEKKRNRLNSPIVGFASLCQQHSDSLDESLTFEASPVRGIHGYDGLRDTGGTADSCPVQSPHPEDVRTALHQPRDREAGVLDRGIVALCPVVGSHFTPASTTHKYITFVNSTGNIMTQLSWKSY